MPSTRLRLRAHQRGLSYHKNLQPASGQETSWKAKARDGLEKQPVIVVVCVGRAPGKWPTAERAWPELSYIGHWATAEEGNAEDTELRSKESPPCICHSKPSCDEVNIWPVGKGEMFTGSTAPVSQIRVEESQSGAGRQYIDTLHRWGPPF